MAVLGGELDAEDPERGAAEAEIESVERDRQRSARVAPEKVGHERDKGHPEKKIEIRPEQAGIHLVHRMDEVMMVHPHDGDDQKAESVAKKDRALLEERGPGWLLRRRQLQHHDGDDDSDDAVAEGFDASGGHLSGGHG